MCQTGTLKYLDHPLLIHMAIRMLLEVIYNHLKAIGVFRINDDLVEVTVDASCTEYVFDCVPHSFEDVAISIQMY